MIKKASESGQVKEYEREISRYTILVAGSRWIREDYVQKSELAKMVGAKIMDEKNWILLNNGATETSSKGIVSIAQLVCNGAQDELIKTISLKAEKERILTLIPEGTNYKFHNIGRVEIAGKTPHLRRIELARRADAVITIEGSLGTKEIIELTVASKKPILPISCTGGESEKGWKNSEKYILQTFGIEKQSEEYEMLTTSNGLNNTLKLSDLVIKMIKNKLEQDETAFPSHRIVIDKDDLLNLIREVGSLKNMNDIHLLGETIHDIENKGVSYIGNIKLTKDDLPLTQMYADLATISAVMYKTIDKKPNSVKFFIDVVSSVRTIVQEYHGELAFPYDNIRSSDKSEEFVKTISSLLNGVLQLRLLNFTNIHEWVVKPGRLLFVEFFMGFDRKLKNKIAKIYAGRQSYNRDDILALEIALEIFSESTFPTDKLWYPLVSYLSVLLVNKIAFKNYYEINWDDI